MNNDISAEEYARKMEELRAGFSEQAESAKANAIEALTISMLVACGERQHDPLTKSLIKDGAKIIFDEILRSVECRRLAAEVTLRVEMSKRQDDNFQATEKFLKSLLPLIEGKDK